MALGKKCGRFSFVVGEEEGGVGAAAVVSTNPLASEEEEEEVPGAETPTLVSPVRSKGAAERGRVGFPVFVYTESPELEVEWFFEFFDCQ